MAFTLPDLPYPADALEPDISERTMQFHHGKHHKGYVDKLNKLIEGTRFEDMALEDIIIATARDPEASSIFNTAGQAWNHTFFWRCMTPDDGGGMPGEALAKRIQADFGSLDSFREKFIGAATGQFGSGWVWLVEDQSNVLRIVPTANAVCPMVYDQKALLTCDVWEHAYYLDYQNRRGDFVAVFVDNLANWAFAEERLATEPPEAAARAQAQR